MKQKFTAGERRGLIVLLILMAGIVGLALWQHLADNPKDSSTTVVAQPSDSTTSSPDAQAEHKPKRKQSAKSNGKPAKSPRKPKKDKAPKTPKSGPTRSPLDDRVPE